MKQLLMVMLLCGMAAGGEKRLPDSCTVGETYPFMSIIDNRRIIAYCIKPNRWKFVVRRSKTSPNGPCIPGEITQTDKGELYQCVKKREWKMAPKLLK